MFNGRISRLLLIPAFGLFAACSSGQSQDAGDVSTMDSTIDSAADVQDTASNPDGSDAMPALPDLTIDQTWLQKNIQFGMQYFAPNACEINEQCVGAPGWRLLLMFNTRTPNLGPADLDLGEASMTNPNFVWDPCHHHYHFMGYANYTLLGPDGGTVAMGHKQSFCVEDLLQVDFSPGIRTTAQFDSCGTGGLHQGISAGWADEYYPNLPCQWIDVTGVPAGAYRLHVDLNPEHRIQEADYTNNSAEADVTIPSQWIVSQELQPCGAGDVQGVGRDCGWMLDGSHDCLPGETVSVGCNSACGVGSCTGSSDSPLSWDIRICEGNSICAGGDAMHVLQQDFGECGTGVFSLDSTCGVAVFTCPPSGRYTVMYGADAPPDPTSTCTLQTIHSGLPDAGDAAVDAASDASGDSGTDAGAGADSAPADAVSSTDASDG